ncbi:MAG TPA: glycosyltransferase [Candidatus Kapabacteria bacterium]|nr:glycosyltransferase [Candidatus Kapabacteria bacterium]
MFYLRQILSWKWTCCVSALGLVWLWCVVRMEPVSFSSLNAGAELFERMRQAFPSVGEQTSPGALLCPAVIVLAIAGSLRLLFDRPADWLRLPISIGFLTLQLTYLGYRLLYTLCLDTLPNSVLSVLFFVSELFIHFRIALGNISLLRVTDRSREADESQRLARSGMYLPWVDVFLPTYSEPVEMLRRSIIGCQAMEYPNKTIYLLDDQRRPEMRELAMELGCEYMDRPDNRHAKAGNLNHALPLTHGELILCFDADFIPCRDFLQRTVGFFRDAEVALVQTPQNFFNEDAITRNLGLANALEDEQRLFFRMLQPGRDTMNAIVCHGSCFIARRSALEAIGGVPTETITEDWATSIRLQAAGHKLYYLNEPLSAGVSADKCGEFVQQRARWAQGTIQALYASTNPLTVPGLNWKQRVMHFSSIVYYVGSISSLFNLIAPLLFLFFGVHLLRMTVEEMLVYRLPFTVGFYILYSWLTCGTRSPFWTEVYEALLAPSMGLTALRSLFKPFGTGFRVTDKAVRQGRLAMNRRVAFPFALLLVLHLVGIAWSILVQRPVLNQDAFAIVLYFSCTNIALLWLCLLISVDVAQQSRFVRLARQTSCIVTWEDTGLSGETVSISEGDLVFKVASEGTRPELPASVYVHLPEWRLFDIAARVTTAGATEITIEFLDLTLQQRRVLINCLFCEPRQWDRPARSEISAAWEYLRAPFRIYPLAESP